jgi:hypothetical protein
MTVITDNRTEILEVVVTPTQVYLKYKIRGSPISGTGVLPKDTVITQEYSIQNTQLIKIREDIQSI